MSLPRVIFYGRGEYVIKKVTRGDIEERKEVFQSTEIKAYPETAMLAERLEWFQDLKLGIIVHWGLYAEAGIVESWQLSEADTWAREPISWREDVRELQRDYWQLNRVFNPTAFNPQQWAKTFQKAGVKYLIFTTKHHDGFNLYDTQVTDYKIGGRESPYQGDLFGEMMEAAKAEGLATGAYYSKADWHSEDYWLPDETVKGRRASYSTQEQPEIWERYVTFVHQQIRELTHNYGPLDLLWLDAGWCGKGAEDLEMDRLVDIAREEQEKLIVVDRMMGGRHENYVTPERSIPTVSDIPKQVWESNIPLGNDWGYVPTDTFKSSQEVIEMFVDVVAKGGNLLLGVGPTPQGEITKEEELILSELGSWLEIYSEGIYETRKMRHIDEEVPWKMTRKDNAIFAFYPVTKPLPRLITTAELGLAGINVLTAADLKTGVELVVEEQSIIVLPAHSQQELGMYGIKIMTEKGSLLAE